MLVAATVEGHGTVACARAFWPNGDFKNPVPFAGGFALVDTGERYGEWRVVGEAGNVSWTSGSYVHDGFHFVSQQGAGGIWVNLAGISRTATGIAHGPVATTAGQAYTLTFYVGNLVDPTGFYGQSSSVKVYENSTLLMVATNSDGAGSDTEIWKEFTVTFNADAAYTTIAFVNGDPEDDRNCGIANTNLAPAAAGSTPASRSKGR